MHLNKQKIFLVFFLLLLISGCRYRRYSDYPYNPNLSGKEYKELIDKICAEGQKEQELQSQINTIDCSNITGYGQISKTTGRIRTNVVSGYYRNNGTYVRSYARS